MRWSNLGEWSSSRVAKNASLSNLFNQKKINTNGRKKGRSVDLAEACVVPNSHHERLPLPRVRTHETLFLINKKKVSPIFHCTKYLMPGWVIVLVVTMGEEGEIRSMGLRQRRGSIGKLPQNETTIGITRELRNHNQSRNLSDSSSPSHLMSLFRLSRLLPIRH